MTLQEVLHLLIKSPSIDKIQMEIVKKSLLAKVRKHEELEYFDQVFLEDAYDTSLKLIITRLRGGQDPEPCEDIFDLAIEAPPRYSDDLFKWIEENTLLEDPNLINEKNGTHRTIYAEFAKLQIISKYARKIDDWNERHRLLKDLRKLW